MKLFKLILTIIIITTSAFKASSQGAYVRAELDTSYILVGDQINFTLTAEQLATAKVIFPELKDSIIGQIKVLSAHKPDTIKNTNNYIRVIRKYTITSFDSGDYTIPALPFKIESANGTDSIFSNTVFLGVRNAEAPKGKEPIFDIKSVLKVPYTFIEILTWAGIIILILLVIGLIVYVILKRRNNAPIFKYEKPAEPPHVIAFRELDDAKAAKLWQQGQIKQYYSRLSEIVKAYFERRYNILAVESTTDEVLEYFKGKDDKLYVEIEKILRQSDLVKFAKAQPMPNENEEAWQIAYNIVLQTKNEIIAEAENSIPEQPKNA